MTPLHLIFDAAVVVAIRIAVGVAELRARPPGVGLPPVALAVGAYARVHSAPEL